jgi:hypothetical protein
MGKGRVVETELMSRLVGGNTELAGGKGKSGNRFSKPNFETLPKHRQVRRVRRMNRWFLGQGLYRNSKNSSGRLDEELWLEKGSTSG